MKNLVFAALTALAVSACTTVEHMPKSSDIKAPESSQHTVVPEVATVSDDSPAVEDITPDERNSATDQTRETLLYGAMTKFELMTFVEIIRSAGQEAALEQDDIMTVFAPNNSAFEYAGRPEQSVIAEFLSDHMIAGSLDLQNLQAAISENGGPITLKSMSGKTLNVYDMDGKIKLSGANGILATITQSDMMHSNGVMHHISDVLVR